MSTHSETTSRDGHVYMANGSTACKPEGGSLMQVKTHIKAGGLSLNHNETLVRAPSQAQNLKVKTRLKAGGLSLNHNETLVRAQQSATGPRSRR